MSFSLYCLFMVVTAVKPTHNQVVQEMESETWNDDSSCSIETKKKSGFSYSNLDSFSRMAGKVIHSLYRFMSFMNPVQPARTYFQYQTEHYITFLIIQSRLWFVLDFIDRFVTSLNGSKLRSSEQCDVEYDFRCCGIFRNDLQWLQTTVSLICFIDLNE